MTNLKSLQAKLSLSLKALEQAQRAFHYELCMSENTHHQNCKRLKKIITKLKRQKN